MLTYADVRRRVRAGAGRAAAQVLTYAHVCSRMLTSEGGFVKEQGVRGAGAQFTRALLALLVQKYKYYK